MRKCPGLRMVATFAMTISFKRKHNYRRTQVRRGRLTSRIQVGDREGG